MDVTHLPPFAVFTTQTLQHCANAQEIEICCCLTFAIVLKGLHHVGAPSCQELYTQHDSPRPKEFTMTVPAPKSYNLKDSSKQVGKTNKQAGGGEHGWHNITNYRMCSVLSHSVLVVITHHLPSCYQLAVSCMRFGRDGF